MSLVTRCPTCATTFRAQRLQLAARGGRVRCGKCKTVFDGIACLVEESAVPLALEPSPQLGLFDPARRAAPRRPPAPRPEGDEMLPEFLVEEVPQGRFAVLWGLLALLALGALAAQAAFQYRTELALLVPESRRTLEQACRLLGCEVRLPRRPELMGIESSDLQADPRRDQVIVLNAVIRNRAPFPQEYPALELTLTDEFDRAVLRRALRPGEYLDPARAAQGLAAGAEALVRVHFDTGRARATGYRLYLFYP